MAEETGIVKSIQGAIAKVSVPKKSACEGCTLGTCKPDDKAMEIEAFNRAGAEVGQKVRVTMNAYTYTKGSLFIYGLPAIALVIGAVLGREVISGFFPDADSDILSAVCGFSFFGLSFLIIRIWAGRVDKRPETKPVIEEIINH
ncbi:MAG: SoxR reducing system RseC family protein [Nitrospirota bacterium]|nr:SoxR reducing system RseC family protein [Nitrospirota bacterium]